jgi:hypothetical protein
MKYVSDDRGVVPVMLIVLVALLIIVGGYAFYNVTHHANGEQASNSKTPTPSSSPLGSASPAAPTPTPTPSSVFDITSLGVKFTLSGTLYDLTYQVVHLTGDQAVNSVEFSSQRLEAAGCSLSSAPLGYLTYDNDKGGTVVANARNSNIYYLAPTGGTCKAAASLQNWQALESSLKTSVSD